MKIGYARVSTEDQNPDLQLTVLKQAGKRLAITRIKPTSAVKAFSFSDLAAYPSHHYVLNSTSSQ